MTEKHFQRFGPVLRYDDGDKAIAFLSDAFGFKEHAVHRSPEGQIVHAELEFKGDYIGLSERAKGESVGDSIFDLGPCCIYVVLDDGAEIDALCERARAAGTEIVMEPQDQEYGSRDFSARDPENFVWAFGTYRMGS